MGKNFFNKLGNILRVFKGGKKKEFGPDRDDLTDITSESGIQSFGSSSQQESVCINKNLFLKKSKSIESLTTATIDSGVAARVNELKRSNGTCDILSNTKEEDVKCTKSLNRFDQLTLTNNCVFSYNAKLHGSRIWSQALGRVAERPKSSKNESTSSSTIRLDSEVSREEDCIIQNNGIRNEEASVLFQEWKVDKSTDVKKQYPKLENKVLETPNTLCDEEESTAEMFTSSNSQTSPGNLASNDSESNPQMRDVISNLPPNTVPKTILEEAETQLDSSLLVPIEEKFESTKVIIEEQKMTVKMDLKTVKNEQGFDLLKYDLKSSGDHVAETTEDMETEKKHLNLVNSSKLLSENSTEYEVVNLAQVDLFREFKTTISKMRNVLNVLDVKKSLQCVMDRTRSEKLIKRCSSEGFEAENISTQTAGMAFNQISTSTDCGFGNQTRNEGIMVQLSSETTSKRITLDSNLLNQIKPLTKTKRRKRRGFRCKYNKVSKKSMNNVSSSYDKKKSDKPHYHKCVVYHITQHKNAVDRCVGTPCPSVKEKTVLNKTFSALHFGPIKEFSMLLNKHENETMKRKELGEKQRLLSLQRDGNDTDSQRRKSTSFISSDTSNVFNQCNCLKSKTQPSLNCMTSKDHTSQSNSPANWLVFEPSSSVAVREKQSTSEDLVLDKNRSSTQELVSNILQEEFKTSGLKGRISSSTMNMIKDQFCDKLNGIKCKDVPDVMITVCVPLKSIVSKIKTSKRAGCEEKTIPSTTTSTESKSRFLSTSAYDKSTQITVSKSYINDNLQTIPEKMCKKSSEIFQHNKILRETMSSKRLSTFKKIFGNKATSCSNLNPFGHMARKTSKIYFSDHSTSSPDFPFMPKVREASHFCHKKISTTPKPSSISLFREEFSLCGPIRKEGFFLNLPPNRYRKKREQISRLFDGSDSSDQRYFGEPKLLYHVHESSFCSTSKTDDKYSSRRLDLEAPTSQEEHKQPFIPLQEASSKIDINVKPKMISFSDMPMKCDLEDTPEPTKDEVKHEELPKPNLKTVDVNTSYAKLVRDNETQFEIELTASSPTEKKAVKKKARKTLPTESFFNECVEEFSAVTFPKVHFEDEMNEELCDECKGKIKKDKQRGNSQTGEMRSTQVEFVEANITGENTRETPSVLSLLEEDEPSPELVQDKIDVQKINESQTDKTVQIKDGPRARQKEKTSNNKKQQIILQTSSDSNLIFMNQMEFGDRLPNSESTTPYGKKRNRKRSRAIVRVESTQVDSVASLPRKENFLVQVKPPVDSKNESKLTGLIRDVVNLCNSSFVKSRDCIVELTLYNLIKEIILEHCSHLSEQSRQKVESILADFIKASKQKAGNDNVDIVESAIENLVKEIGSTEFTEKQREEKNEEELGDKKKETERKHRRHSRSKSKRREHKHESKHRSHHRDDDGELKEKHRHKDEEKKYKTKRYHKHHCEKEDICDIGKEESESKFRSVEGKREYEELVQRLRELEEVTKQLSSVAHQKPTTNRLQIEDTDHLYRNNKVYTASVLEKPNFGSKKKMKFSLTDLGKINKEFQKEPVNVNFFQTETAHPIMPVPRNYPKLPVTKIVINLSNLKLLTRNCASLTAASAKEPIVITDSTEQKQKLINKIVSYQMDNGFKTKVRHSSRQFGKVERNMEEDAASGIINKNKESFTITIQGKEKRKKSCEEIQEESSKTNKDFMRIKMVKKKKTVTSTTDHSQSESHCSKKNRKREHSNDVHRITKEYIKKEYKLNSDLLCASLAKTLLENKYNMDQNLDCRGNLDLAYQRMANFCLFRECLKKENCD
ncbi:uncharacterized protein LOC123316339 [Coccinella septempunctata]|uniref:uncharacterized protein LOC123316339 n=1 Tax=Coccinella septempunctata TaxID=41139 RepID=UPI001D084A9D|nr:uncharacterized protein LOC123316339 [Coccinella septempunctata]